MGMRLDEFLSAAAQVATAGMVGRQQAALDLGARQQQQQALQRQAQLDQERTRQWEAQQHRQTEQDALTYFEHGRRLSEADDPALAAQEQAVRGALGTM